MIVYIWLCVLSVWSQCRYFKFTVWSAPHTAKRATAKTLFSPIIVIIQIAFMSWCFLHREYRWVLSDSLAPSTAHSVVKYLPCDLSALNHRDELIKAQILPENTNQQELAFYSMPTQVCAAGPPQGMWGVTQVQLLPRGHRSHLDGLLWELHQLGAELRQRVEHHDRPGDDPARLAHHVRRQVRTRRWQRTHHPTQIIDGGTNSWMKFRFLEVKGKGLWLLPR